MPSGKVHNRVTAIVTVIAILLLPVYIPFTGWWGIAIPFGCITGIPLNPDLDVDKGNRSYYLIRKYFGKGAEALWSGFWWIYKTAFPHRSKRSHFPILSTLIRVLYITWVPLLLGFLNGLITSPGFWYYFFGLCIVDTLHWTMDVATKEIRYGNKRRAHARVSRRNDRGLPSVRLPRVQRPDTNAMGSLQRDRANDSRQKRRPPYFP